ILALDGVRNATYGSEVTPYGDSYWSTAGDNGKISFSTEYIVCDEDFADVWGTEMKKGRFFTEADLTGKYVPIVVNQKFVDKILKDTTALGYSFNMNGMDVTIQGIIDHFKYQGKFRDEGPLTFVPIQNLWGNLGLLSVALHPHADESTVKKMYDITARITRNFDFRIDKVESIRQAKNRASWVPIIGLFALTGFLLINIAMGLFG